MILNPPTCRRKGGKRTLWLFDKTKNFFGKKKNRRKRNLKPHHNAHHFEKTQTPPNPGLGQNFGLRGMGRPPITGGPFFPNFLTIKSFPTRHPHTLGPTCHHEYQKGGGFPSPKPQLTHHPRFPPPPKINPSFFGNRSDRGPPPPGALSPPSPERDQGEKTKPQMPTPFLGENKKFFPGTPGKFPPIAMVHSKKTPAPTPPFPNLGFKIFHLNMANFFEKV